MQSILDQSSGVSFGYLLGISTVIAVIAGIYASTLLGQSFQNARPFLDSLLGFPEWLLKRLSLAIHSLPKRLNIRSILALAVAVLPLIAAACFAVFMCLCLYKPEFMSHAMSSAAHAVHQIYDSNVDPSLVYIDPA